ncbi:MAG: ImmA/IrrE family metallo-endopeptidase [Bdellovibrionales bacterium]|nr:ImmA/IrrE family metallo-endopeptidase [Bdellovibrionales bacterium]
MAKSVEALVNPKMIVWARKKSGFDISGASKRMQVKPERLKAWEEGELRPTIKQAIKMAELYRRPLSVFYLESPPQDFSVAMTDFRRLSDADEGDFSPELLLEIRKAQMRREIMIEFLEEDGDYSFSYLDSISLIDNTEHVARKVRDLLDVSWESQQRWYSPNDALNGWKEAIENLNVLVFHSAHQGITLDPSEAHGFSISESLFPVIVLNSKDVHRRRIFTLLHEFVHLLLDAGGVCDTWEYANAKNIAQRTEVFCNQVAGAVLVPTSMLMAHTILHSHNSQTEWSDEEIGALAQEFSTSTEVVVRRLLALGLVTADFYERKRQEYAKAWSKYKEEVKKDGRQGGPPHHRMVLRNNGKPFTRQIFSAYYDNKITLSDASDFLEAKIKHVKEMEKDLLATTGVGA